jgi:hypothetical protein
MEHDNVSKKNGQTQLEILRTQRQEANAQKSSLKLVYENPSQPVVVTKFKSSFAQQLADYCDDLDKQIENILRS